MEIKAVLFDLDGVLLDTEGSYTEFWEYMEGKHPTGIDNFAYFIKGTTLAKILETHFPDKKLQEEIVAELVVFENSMPFKLFDGAAEMLAAIKDAGLSAAIVTSSGRPKMNRLFKEIPMLNDYIDVVITDEDVTASKPDPQGYLIAAERLGALPDAFVVVEDSINGLKAGRSSRGRVVGLATTNPREAIEPLADFVADSIGDITFAQLVGKDEK